MNKRTIGVVASSGVLLLAVAAGAGNSPQSTKLNSTNNVSNNQSAEVKTSSAPKPKPICDGTTVKTNCTVDGVSYSTYIYHPAVPEKTHTENVTSYQKKVAGYCTLCNDGTYSPSCATGRGACSHHGGVQEWNAPEYENEPVTTTNTVVDAPAQAEYYEKVTQ